MKSPTRLFNQIFCLLLLTTGFINAQTKPYNNLIITEARMSATPQNYVELTNMGTETINLSEFEFGRIGPWNQAFNPDFNTHFRLPAKMLAPGKSYVIALASEFEPENWKKDPIHNLEKVTKPEMYKLADMMLHRQENNSNYLDSITPNWQTMDGWGGRECWYLRHHYLANGMKDSMIIDQVGGIFDEADGTSSDRAHDVAGVQNATNNCVLIRRNIVKTGITDFSSNQANNAAANVQFNNTRGLDLVDSEWIPVPVLGFDNPITEPWRAVFWTTGNQVDAKLDANTLVSKTGKVLVDLNLGTITVPWGVRNDDSIMYQFQRRPGLAWKYDYAPTNEDSAYISARTGDKLILYVCGDQVSIKEFTIIVKAPTTADNIVIPKNGYNYNLMRYGKQLMPYSDLCVTNGISGIDTISSIDFATRADTLLKYLEKAPKATWNIVFKDGKVKPDLKNGDKLRVTSENGLIKDYFLKVDKFVPSDDAYLSSITWPDMPSYFKGALASSIGWKGDTIPGFAPTKNHYIVQIPLGYQGIPALVFRKQHTDSKVVVSGVKSMEGEAADRTLTYTVTAENDTTVNVYTIRFEKEKDYANVQPFTGEPYFSQYIFWESWANSYLEIANPGTEPLDLSNYMITGGWGAPEVVFSFDTSVDSWGHAYSRYVPGKKWQDQANWQVQPAILETDFATNAIVAPGDVFVIADIRSKNFNDINHGNGDAEFRNEIDIDFSKNPWGRPVHSETAIHCWSSATIYMWKILNDSVKNGLKPATDLNDFQLIETWGTGSAMVDPKIGGVTQLMIQSNFRKPEIYKPNPEVGGSNGATPAESEWYFTNWKYYIALNYGWPDQILRVCDGIGSHIMNEVTVSKSTVTSKVYKVSPGYSDHETIRGITTGTTVSAFYQNILKSNDLQTLAVKSASDGTPLAETNAISNGDTLIVLSSDSLNISKYILNVSANGLSSNAMLTSTIYTISATSLTGTIAGIDKNTTLKTVFEGVVVPAGATLTILDENGGYVSFIKLNFESTYVNVIATDKIFFEVIAENSTSRIVYQLTPTTTASDAYVTSDVYTVNQTTSVIQSIPVGSSVYSLLSNISPAPGASVALYDKAGFVREMGDIYGDDKLIVTSSSGNSTKIYSLSMLNANTPQFQEYVTSLVYEINHPYKSIAGSTFENTLITEFLSNLTVSAGSTMEVVYSNGVKKTSVDLDLGDQLKITLSDGNTLVFYSIDVLLVPPVNSHFIPVWTNNGTEHMNINLVSANVNGMDLEIGDEVGIFDGFKCVGVGILTGNVNSNHLLEMRVSLDDGSGNGYTPGNNITYKFFDKSTGVEFINLTATYSNTNPLWSINGKFAIGTTAFVALTGVNHHFIPIWTGNGFDHMNINIYSATLDGAELEAGDEIGIFDGNICVGVGLLTGPITRTSTLDMAVSRNDGSGNGYTSGNAISYKLFDSSNDMELSNVTAVYASDDASWSTDGLFAISVTTFAELIVVTSVNQDIILNTGWNIISTNVVPDNLNLKDIFQVLIDGGTLKKVMDETGKTIENFGSFGGWRNNIGNLNSSKGYKVNVTATSTLSLEGIPVQLPLDLNLNTGWNLIAYPCASTQDARALVQSLIDAGKLKKVMDETGKTIENFGAFGGWKNNIGNFLPGKGYKVNVIESCTLNLTGFTTKAATIIPEVLASNHFSKVYTGNGIDHMNIHLINLSVSGLQAGDEIGVFDGKLCVGSATIGTEQLMAGSISIAASSNDEPGKTVNGFTPGHRVELQLYRANQTYTLNLSKLSGYELFEKNESLFAQVNANVLTGLQTMEESAQFKCYPNPFTKELTIEVHNAKQTEITVDIYNLAGQRIKSVFRGTNNGYLGLKWNGTNESGQKAAPGIYLLKVNGQSKQVILESGK